MALNPSQKKWVNDSIDFHSERYFVYIQNSFPTRNYEEFRKTEIGESYEQLQTRGRELFSEDQFRKFCMTSVITDKAAKSRALGAMMKPNVYTGSCECLRGTECPDCSTDGYCGPAGGCSGGTGCGCVWWWSCNGMCYILPEEN